MPKKRIPKLPRFEYFKDTEGGQRFRFRGPNGKILYSSVVQISKTEVGKWIPGHFPEDKYIYIVIVRGVVVIILRVKIPNPINPVADGISNNFKTELAAHIKAAHTMSKKLTGVARPLVIDTELAGVGKGLTNKPVMKPLDINGFNVKEFVKDILK